MTREEMIKKLSQITLAATPTIMTMDMGIEYDYITEKGAGTTLGSMGEWPAYQFTGIEAEKWAVIREKLENKTITEQDFDGTDIKYIIRNLHNIYGDLYNQFYKDVAATFASMLELPESLEGTFFGLFDIRDWGEKPIFFADKPSLEEEFRSSYCCEITEWEDMDDKEIQYWFNRFEDDLEGLVINDYTDEEDEEDEPDPEELREQHREEMLEKLSTVKFEYISPGNWDDVGFTERDIWVNSKGYGYLYCDEPQPITWTGDGLDESAWLRIKEKLENYELEYEDILNTPLLAALKALYIWDDSADLATYADIEEYTDPNSALSGLLKLPNGATGKLYVLMDSDSPEFFSTAEELKKAYERDWCNYYWDDLEDNILELWIERLFGEEK